VSQPQSEQRHSGELGETASALQAFYDRLSPDVFQANEATVGPWDATLQHGGPPAALLGRALEAQGGPPGSRIARLAFDFFGPVPVSQVSIETGVLRGGTRVQLSEATMRANGRVVLRATAWHLLAESGRSPAVPSSFIVPELPTHEVEARFRGMGRFPYGDAIEWRFAEGSYADLGRATVWTRCRIPLVRGSALTGLQRVLIMVDAANGISAVLPFATWTFVPIDLIVTAYRIPDEEWVGMAAQTTIGTDGIGVTETLLFDAVGAFGRALQTLYVGPR
jgi:Acyl-CoA thioesterase C-terminal domain/Acyl-CoA thioesterase N-terminal domain